MAYQVTYSVTISSIQSIHYDPLRPVPTMLSVVARIATMVWAMIYRSIDYPTAAYSPMVHFYIPSRILTIQVTTITIAYSAEIFGHTASHPIQLRCTPLLGSNYPKKV